MAAITCPIPECDYTVGEDVPSDCKGTLLQLHLVHHQTKFNSSAATPAKLKRPSITADSSTEDWSYFLSRWGTYKRATKLSGLDVTVQMLECCDEELRKNLTRVHKNSVANMDESELLGAIKRLAVIEESTLVSRYKLHNLQQDIDEPIRSFVARIKGQAHICKLFVPCPECQFAEVDFSDEIIKDVVTRGIVDEDIRLNLLGESNQNMSLEDTISYIEAKESGKKSACRLLSRSSTTAATTSRYKKNQKQSKMKKKCSHCDRTDHSSNFTDRKAKCSAFNHACKICRVMGHLESVCRRRNVMKTTNEAQGDGEEASNSISDDAIFDTLCASKCNIVGASSSKSCSKMFRASMTLDHYVYDNIKRFWELKPSDSQPTIQVSVTVSESSYNDLRLGPVPTTNPLICTL